MVVEKRVSKGGFFHIFDWSGKSKSRKNPFRSNSKFDDDDTKQVNEPIDKLIEIAPDAAMGLIHEEGFDSKQASSVSSSDEGYGTVVPSVVAKLMGLDSLPSSIVTSEHHCSKNALEITHANEAMEYDVFLLKPRSQKRIQPFGSKVLPPKSTKSTPTTDHKLLPSCIVKSKNNATFRSSSFPTRIEDLKQKTEAAKNVPRPEKLKDPALGRDTKVPRLDGFNDGSMHKTYPDSEKIGSVRLKSDEKSLSLALQAKLNVQRREKVGSCSNRRGSGLTSGSNESYVNPKKHVSKIQLSLQSRAQKKSTQSVLRRYNQKQNNASHKVKFSSKTPGSCQQVKKSLSLNESYRPPKAISTVVLGFSSGLKMTGSVRTDIENDFPSSKTQTSQKKHFVDNNKQNQFLKKNSSVSANHFDESMESSVSISGSTHEVIDIRKKSLDVVSFTFNSPIKRSEQAPLSRSPETDQSSLLSLPLDEQLLACKVGNNGIVEPGTATDTASDLQELVSTSVVKCNSEEPQIFQFPQYINNSDGLIDIGSFSGDVLLLKAEQKEEDLTLDNHCGSWKSDNNAEVNLISQPHIPISVLEPCFSSDESYLSSDSLNSDNNNGTIRCLAIENSSASEAVILSHSSCIERDASWEFQYVKNIVTNAELRGVGRIFEDLEIKQDGFESEWCWLERKVWFECIRECLDLRWQEQFHGRKRWLEKKGSLVGELYREIMGWKKMSGQVVDDVVERDMSRADGKWAGFGMEGFEEGVKIETEILSCLLNDLVTDIFFDLI